MHLGADGVELLERVACVVKSPGVPHEAPVIAAARERGLPVLGELELAWRLLPNRVRRRHRAPTARRRRPSCSAQSTARRALPVAVAGNVGTRADARSSARLDPDADGRLRGRPRFQLEDTVDVRARGARVLLNLAPDHLDRHGTFEAYRAAKLRVFAHQGNDDVAVAPLGLGVEDLGGCARRVCFGDRPQAELADRAGQLWWGERAADRRRGDRACAAPHNRANAMAAAAVCAGARDRARRGARGPADVRRRRAPPRGGRRRRRRALRQRLEGHQRRLDARRARVASTRRST